MAEFSFGTSHVRSQPRMQDELVLKRQLPNRAAQDLRFMEVVAMSGTKEFVTLAVTHDALFAVNPFSATSMTVEPLVYLTDIQELNMLPGAVDVFMRKAVNASSAQVEIRTAVDTISFFTFEEDTRIFFHIERAWTRRKARAARGLDIPPPLLTAHELRQLYHSLENELVGNGPCTAVVRGHGHNVAWTILQGRVDGVSKIDIEAKSELAEFLSGRHNAVTQSLGRATADSTEDKEHQHALEQFRVKALLARSESPKEEELRNNVQWQCFPRRDDAVKWLLLSSGAGIPHNDATERRLRQLQTDATEFVYEKIELMRELREAAYFSPDLKEAFYDSHSLLGFIVGDLQRYAHPCTRRSDETDTPRTTELEYVLECFNLLEAMTFDNECVRLREDVLNPRPYSVGDMFAVLCHDFSGLGGEGQESAGGSPSVAKFPKTTMVADTDGAKPVSRIPALRSHIANNAMQALSSSGGAFADAVRMVSAPAAKTIVGAGQSRWASAAGAALAQRKESEKVEQETIRSLLQQIDRAQVAVFVELNMTMQQTMVEGGNIRNDDTVAAFFALAPQCRPRIGAYIRQIIALLQESAKAKDDRRKAKVRMKQHRGQQRALTAQRKQNVEAKHRVDERGRRVERARQGLDADIIRRLSLEGANDSKSKTKKKKSKRTQKLKGNVKDKGNMRGAEGGRKSTKGDDDFESGEEAENGGDDNQSSDEDYRSSDDEHEGRSPLSKAQLVNPKDRKHSYVLWQHCRFLRTLALSNHKLRRFMRDDYEEEFSFFLSSSHFLTKFDHRLEFARLAKQDLLEIVRVVGFSVGEEHEQGAAS